MTTLFPDREQAFERLFAHQEEMRFHARVRRNVLIATWACGRMRLPQSEADRFIDALVDLGVVTGDGMLLDRLQTDLADAGVAVTPDVLHREMERCSAAARAEQQAALSTDATASA